MQSLQQIGATARDIISTLQAMKEAGVLEADLRVMWDWPFRRRSFARFAVGQRFGNLPTRLLRPGKEHLL